MGICKSLFVLKHQHATSSAHLSPDTREVPVESPGSQTSQSLSHGLFVHADCFGTNLTEK